MTANKLKAADEIQDMISMLEQAIQNLVVNGQQVQQAQEEEVPFALGETISQFSKNLLELHRHAVGSLETVSKMHEELRKPNGPAS